MEVKGAATVFQVKSVESSLAFYVGVLGFAEDFRYGNYAGVSRGEMYLHLCEHDVWKRPLGGGAVSIFCDEVDAYCTEVAARGAKIAGAPAGQQYGMRDFVLRDPDGNVLTFGCPLKDGPEGG